MISFIVLAFNEEANILPTVDTISRAAAATGLDNFEVVVVDDGSRDRTAEVLKQRAAQMPHLRIVTNEVNLGVGASICKGLAVAKCPRVMIVPGDNDMSFEMMRLLLRYRDTADVVLAFPINTEDRSLGRHVLSVLYRLIHVVAFRVYVNYVNAPSICPTELMQSLGLKSPRYSIVAEYTVKLLRSGCSFAEVPGFVQNPNVGRKRRTVTLRNLSEVVVCFLRLCKEIYVTDRARYDRKPRRVFIDFAGGVIPPIHPAQPGHTPASERAVLAGAPRDART